MFSSDGKKVLQDGHQVGRNEHASDDTTTSGKDARLGNEDLYFRFILLQDLNGSCAAICNKIPFFLGRSRGTTSLLKHFRMSLKLALLKRGIC